MSMYRHVYSTIRVVPNPASGEYANLGAIAGCDETGEWTIRSLQNESRARQFCGADALAAAHDFVTRVGMDIDSAEWFLDLTDGGADTPVFIEPTVTEGWLRDLASRQRHVIQLSPPAPIMAESVEEAMDQIFRHMIKEPERRSRGLTKWALLRSMNLGYERAGLELGRDFDRRVPLVAGGDRRFTHFVDYVVAGNQAAQLVQMWSFQGDSQTDLSREVKAWGWTMRELRDNGGVARGRQRDVAVPRDVPVDVVVAGPEPDQDRDRYDEALSVFEELGAVVRAHGQEDSVATDAASLLAAPG